jgi:hypothetical protein
MKVSIQQFIDFKLKEGVTDENFTLELAKHFLNINLEDKLSIVIAKYKLKSIVDLFSTDHKLVTTFKHKGIKYGFIPNISEDITLGEYIDLNNYSSNPLETVNWLSILYRPITIEQGKLYQIEEYKGKAYPFEDLDVKILLGAQAFFLSLWKRYQKAIQYSLKEEQMVRMN